MTLHDQVLLHWQGRTIESLTEEWLETRNDELLHELQTREQYFTNAAFGPRVGAKKRYDSGALSIHFHASLNRSGNRYDLCISAVKRSIDDQRVHGPSGVVVENKFRMTGV